MRVPMLDPSRRSVEEVAAMRAAFDRVLASGRYILGEEVEAFERACRDKLGAAHAIGVSSGTDALLVALTAIGVGAGDEVICPAFTFVATAEAIARLGATPVFADISRDGFTIDAADVARKTTEKTRAIVPVHLFGEPADLDGLRAFASRRAVAVVEDAAQAFGSSRGGAFAGTLGAMGCFSFFPSKSLAAIGDAGMIVTSDAALADRARLLRSHGSRDKRTHEILGGNFRMDALQAALLRVALESFDRRTARRRANARRIIEALAGSPLALPTIVDGHTAQQLVVRLDRRDELRAFLAARGVETAVYYPVPLHRMPCFGPPAVELPNSERAAREALALPVFAELTEEEIDHVCRSIAAFFSG